ncbi:MAG TPA: EAL domain-containing protein [Candidatus Baltobacteraceae bacterium]|nr:EAL domain-containing protein [Candidatus Baltobacteraceae bacterium]
MSAQFIVSGIFFTAACAELVTFAVLLALFRREPLLSTLALVGGFLFAGLLALGLSLTMPVGPDLSPLITAWAHAASWTYVCWHVGVSIAALAYVAVRLTATRRARPVFATGAQAIAVIVVATVAACAVFTACVEFAPRLPALSAGEDMHGYWRTGVGQVLIAFHAMVLLVFAWAWGRGAIPRAALLGYGALVVEFVLRVLSGERFTVAWYVAHLLFLAASSFVLAATIHQLLGWRDRAKLLERNLEGEARQAELHAKRLATLSRLVAPTGSDQEHLNALLAEGTRGLQPRGPAFHGIIARVDDESTKTDELVVVASYASHSSGADFIPRIGMRFGVADAPFADVLRMRRTASWADVRSELAWWTAAHAQNRPWAAVAATPFLVEGAQYVLAFGSAAPLARPFEPLDHAYIETLASLCALRLQEMQQRDLLRRAIEYDPLTGTLNRTTFRERVASALRSGAEGALLVVDVDNFREVNEQLGYQTGDELLVQIATTLCRSSGPREIIGRLGDDRFAIFTEEPARERIAQRAATYLHTFQTPLLAAGEYRALTSSIGIATAPNDGTDFERLVVRAEAAVFAAKEAGGARSAFFDGRAEERFISFRRMKSELCEALARRQLTLYFQPHVELATGRVAGLEALLRWNHPERGIVPPNTFLPFAEEHGLIGTIGEWVIGETIRRSRRWRLRQPDLTVWFNVSAAELADPSFIERLQRFGPDLSGLGAEITETVAMNDVASSTKTLSAMRETGLRIALDDFGTGYSSLAQLKRLPIDVVKVDRAFISGVPDDVHDVAIVEAVLGLASCYGFETIAEGVESDTQIAWLAYVGCTYAQGFAYARPMPAHELDAWFAARAGITGDEETAAHAAPA